eukprot:s2743_g8.t2
MGMKFEQGTADPNIWKILNEDGELQGLIVVYVDDYLVTAPCEICEDVHEWFSTAWQTTEIQYAAKENSIRFLGMEIQAVEDAKWGVCGLLLSSKKYVHELIRQRTGMASSALQARPLAYTVSVMGSLMSKDPARAVQVGMKAMAYLNFSKGWKLLYRTITSKSLVTYTDSSYAPDGSRSHGGAVVFWAGAPVAWRTGRQSLKTTSSAETELSAASEGSVLTFSVDALLTDMGTQAESRELRVDNSAAITLASEEGGSWRTRHLKVRAAALRQRIQEGWIAISYCPGDFQLADGLTKILAAKRMQMLMRRWGLGPMDQDQDLRATGR